MSPLEQHRPTHISPPKIRIQSASPETSVEVQRKTSAASPAATPLSPRRVKSLPASTVQATDESLKQLTKKRSATLAGFADTEKDRDMAVLHSRPSSESAKRAVSSPPSKKAKMSTKDVDWSDVTDPEERRRIQNRIAQRKFREKARENKEKAERDSRNQENAGNSYRIPAGNDVNAEPEPSGLPWGSLNLSLVVSRGHEAESRRSSGRGTYVGDDGLPAGPNANAYGQDFAQTASYGSSGGDEAFYDESFIYDATSAAPFPTR